ncbi:DUF4232 domain-containing protein [Kitasatospora sp. NPDC096147]|uniref:DUF4232 domain-containing protein n=1 Tax=Kitasatospora sp. NPDC096147 TaxID=3364093 RepID=UPI0038210CEE
MHVRKLAFTALAVAAALSLTACQDGATSTADASPTNASPTGAPTTAAPSPTNAAPTTPAPTGSAVSSTPPAGTTATPGKAAKCLTTDLTVTAADRTIDGDGDRTVVVELKNRSGRDCTIAGYAGVDLKTSAGALSAKRSGEPVVAGVLASGKSTYFGITYPANTSGGSGVRITGLVVTPPDETHPVTLAWPGAGSLPVTEDGGSPVKVGPVGSAGQGG